MRTLFLYAECGCGRGCMWMWMWMWMRMYVDGDVCGGQEAGFSSGKEGEALGRWTFAVRRNERRRSSLCDIHRVQGAGCAFDLVVKSARSVFDDEACGECGRPDVPVRGPTNRWTTADTRPSPRRRLEKRATLHSRRQQHPLDSVSTTSSIQSAGTLCPSDRRPV